MNREQAKTLIKGTFEDAFDKSAFRNFIANLLKTYDRGKNLQPRSGIQAITERYIGFISSWERIGRYIDQNNRVIDILVVNLAKDVSLYRARTAQRNFVAEYLQGRLGTTSDKDAALVAFVSPDSEDWRFSLVKMEYRFKETNSGKKVQEEFSPAKRWSFLVGKNEKSHTAQTRFLPIIENDNRTPTLEDLEEAFNVEVVTKEFFEKYRDLFIKTKIEIDKILKTNKKVQQEFQIKNINSVDFAKKLLGQIVFLYFLQKKGWFGIEKGKPWGTGPRDFIRRLFNKEFGAYNNFYNDVLEPLFYEALRTDRSIDDHYYSRFNCKIPFLNGGLFDPINNFDWVNVDIPLPNDLFSNTNRTEEGDIGDGILDIFDRYNFTVNEEEPLEKEVALDPELLGKIYEKLNAIRQDNFDEYVKVLKSGGKGEETKFNREYGVYYTPREIVHYMCQESIINYLETELNGKIPREDIAEFVKYADLHLEHERTTVEKKEKVERGEQKETGYDHNVPKSVIQNAKLLDELLANITVCDPAVGSGAFPIGMLHEIVKLRQLLSIYLKSEKKTYDLKRHCIENSLYGVDIDAGAVEICKLRFWLSLIVDEEDFYNIKPLPNLDYKILQGDSLLGIPVGVLLDDKIKWEIVNMKRILFSATNPQDKIKIKEEIDKLFAKQIDYIREYQHPIEDIKFDFRIYFSEVFDKKGGFDIAIANPPYISTKGVDEKLKPTLMDIYGFADDTYNHFFFKAMEILKRNGVLSFITSKTFWTIQTKKNLREHLLKYTICQIFDTANPFENAMVDTCVTIVKKGTPEREHEVLFLDGKEDIIKPRTYSILQTDYADAPNKVFFIPTDYNKKIYQKLGKKVKELLSQWWDEISTSRNIEKNKMELEKYRNSLKPGDITLLGLITEGGVGIQTGDNGKYVGVLEGTKWAENIRKQRSEKLLSATEFCKKYSIKTKNDAQKLLDDLSEKDIRKLFDNLKEKYGRDVFGRGWLFRIVSKDEIADVDSLTEDEKLNGIAGARTFVPYDKGDKDGNRWYAPTPYFIDWSKENVKVLQTDPKARWQGYQFYFREGFCWNNVLSDEKIKCRLKEKSVHSTEAMTFISLIPNLANDKYLVCLLNSNFLGNYRMDFINVSHHLTTGDAKEFPVIIPTSDQLKKFEEIFNRAYKIQKSKFEGKISESEAEVKLAVIQKELDVMVEEMYMG